MASALRKRRLSCASPANAIVMTCVDGARARQAAYQIPKTRVVGVVFAIPTEPADIPMAKVSARTTPQWKFAVAGFVRRRGPVWGPMPVSTTAIVSHISSATPRPCSASRRCRMESRCPSSRGTFLSSTASAPKSLRFRCAPPGRVKWLMTGVDGITVPAGAVVNRAILAEVDTVLPTTNAESPWVTLAIHPMCAVGASASATGDVVCPMARTANWRRLVEVKSVTKTAFAAIP